MINSILKSSRLIASSSDDDGVSVSREHTAKTMDMNYSSHSSCSSVLDFDFDTSSDTSSLPRPKSKRNIQFCQEVAYHLIPNLDELTDEEYYNSFYMEREIHKMRKQNFDFARRVDVLPHLLRACEDQDSYSLRGIEHYRNRATFEAKKNYKRKHSQAVLTTQLQLQISSTRFDDTERIMNKLSEASSMHSVQSAALAVMRAAADALAAKDVFENDQHGKSKSTKNNSNGLLITPLPTLSRRTRRNSLTPAMA